MKYMLGELFETTIKTENRWFDPLVLELLAHGEIICPKQVFALDTIGMQPYKFVSCHPTFTDIFLVNTKSTKVGWNSRSFLELSMVVRLGWVWE